MDHPQLRRLVEDHELAERELQASAMAVWAALAEAEPELAKDILRLFGTADAAARWANRSSRELGGSPARHAAEGRAATIMSAVRMTEHGFAGKERAKRLHQSLRGRLFQVTRPTPQLHLQLASLVAKATFPTVGSS